MALYQVVVEEVEVKRTTVEVRAADEAEAEDRAFGFVRDGMYTEHVDSDVAEVVSNEGEVQEGETELLEEDEEDGEDEYLAFVVNGVVVAESRHV